MSQFLNLDCESPELNGMPEISTCRARQHLEEPLPKALVGYGLFVDSPGVEVFSSTENNAIYQNQSGGILVNSFNQESLCKQTSLIHSVWVRETSIYENGGVEKDLFNFGDVLPSPEGVIIIKNNQGENLISGELPISKLPLSLKNGYYSDNIVVEVYGGAPNSEGRYYLGSKRGLQKDGSFQFKLEGKKEIGFSGIVARFQDPIQKWSSPFSKVFQLMPLNSLLENDDSDWDNDGLKNEQEDLNQNGLVDLGETNPRFADTDGDGLTDGEERLLIGYVEKVQTPNEVGESFRMQNSRMLDPTNPDSDGDCLPDGLELGLSKNEIDMKKIPPNLPSLLSRLSKGCVDQIKKEGGVKPENGIWKSEGESWETLLVLFDLDKMTITDPTNFDTDQDKLIDGKEDLNLNGRQDEETNPSISDTDGDGLLDGEEKLCSATNPCSSSDSNSLLRDTDDDGLSDGEELNTYNTLPGLCDTDGDGLADGMEVGIIHPNAQNPKCNGLQESGSNFLSLQTLNPTKKDSDRDGIFDGVEDANQNGWLDFNETDPTNSDSDGDGLEDGIEMLIDADANQLPDVDFRLLEHGNDCDPPATMIDLDCDGLINARDKDSDGDGCLDSDEGLSNDTNYDGIADVWQKKAVACLKKEVSVSTSKKTNGVSLSGDFEVPNGKLMSEALPITGGGACTIRLGEGRRIDHFTLMSLFLLIGYFYFRRKNKWTLKKIK